MYSKLLEKLIIDLISKDQPKEERLEKTQEIL